MGVEMGKESGEDGVDSGVFSYYGILRLRMSFQTDLYLAINHARIIPAIRKISKWKFSIQEAR